MSSGSPEQPVLLEAMHDPFSLLRHLWQTGVDSVSGRRSVARALERDGLISASLVIAVGKAAGSMFLGAQPCISRSTRSIIVSKYGHIDPVWRFSSTGEVIEAGHPVPDDNSLRAGEIVLQAVSSAGPQDRLLLLVSGGASALAEALKPGFRLADVQLVTRALSSSGQPIAEINEVRSRMSRIKGGRLLRCFSGEEVRVYAISDVQDDRLSTIGGGIGDPAYAAANVQARVVAANRVARNAAAEEAGRMAFPVRLNEESLYGDVGSVAGKISRLLLRGPAGVYIWGGEPTIELPPHPGMGGRNQSLALAIASRIRGTHGISVLVAGTDGTDGPTDYAGAYVNGETVDNPEQAEAALQNADAGTFLSGRQGLFRPGPTDTNVMDLAIATVA